MKKKSFYWATYPSPRAQSWGRGSLGEPREGRVACEHCWGLGELETSAHFKPVTSGVRRCRSLYYYFCSFFLFVLHRIPCIPGWPRTLHILEIQASMTITDRKKQTKNMGFCWSNSGHISKTNPRPAFFSNVYVYAHVCMYMHMCSYEGVH